MLRTTKNRGTGLRATEGCHPEAGIWADRIPGGEGARFWSVILRPVFGPKDLALEVLQSQNRGPSRYSGRQTKAKSRPFALLRTTDKGKIEVLRLAQDDRYLDVILNEVIAEHPEHSEGRISPLRQSRTKPEILRA